MKNNKKLSTLNSQLSTFQRGFTLIELLVVIVIIGVLTALILANFVGIRQRARDGQRKADLRQIQAALELYRSDDGSYPPESEVNDCKEQLNKGDIVYLREIPCDPLGENVNYVYKPSPDRKKYDLVACLENENDGQKDSQPDTSCSAADNRYSITYKNP